MKTISRKSFALSAAVLELGAVLGTAQPTLAAPRDKDDARPERRDTEPKGRAAHQAASPETRQDAEPERRDVRQPQSPTWATP